MKIRRKMAKQAKQMAINEGKGSGVYESGQQILMLLLSVSRDALAFVANCKEPDNGCSS